jgi:hypothetical protein
VLFSSGTSDAYRAGVEEYCASLATNRAQLYRHLRNAAPVGHSDDRAEGRPYVRDLVAGASPKPY